MIQERIAKYLEYKGLSAYRFYKETNLSNGLLNKKGSIGSENCEIIINQYPDINPEWLLTGRGNMLRDGINNGIINNGSNANNVLIKGGKEHKVEQAQQAKESKSVCQNTEIVCNTCMIKDKLIASLEKQIILLEGQLNDKK